MSNDMGLENAIFFIDGPFDVRTCLFKPQSPLHMLTTRLPFAVLGHGLYNASSLNRWTVVYYHVIRSHLCFLLLELRADADLYLRGFHA